MGIFGGTKMKLTAGLAGMALAAIIGVSMPASRPAPVTPNQRHFEFSYVAHVPELPGGAHAMRVWIPIPQSGAHQQITNVRISSPVTRHIVEEENYGNKLAYFDFSTAATRGPFDIRLTFDAQRDEYKVGLPAGDPPASAGFSPDVARFLQPDRLVPIDGVIGEISREQTKGITDPLAKARALYDYVLRNMHYDHAGTGWGHGDAVWACSSHHGNCTDFHSLFIGLARAAGIPARFEIGFAVPADAQGKIGGYHCWAEFYVQGIGWIPIDAAEASQMPARRDYFFGALDENRVRFSRGRDLQLNPKQAGAPVNYLVYPYAELDGKPFVGVTQEFSYRDLDAPVDH
jgi:transglutaminase-like putative cysteine protease